MKRDISKLKPAAFDALRCVPVPCCISETDFSLRFVFVSFCVTVPGYKTSLPYATVHSLAELRVFNVAFKGKAGSLFMPKHG